MLFGTSDETGELRRDVVDLAQQLQALTDLSLRQSFRTQGNASEVIRPTCEVDDEEQEAKDLELKLANFEEWDGSIKRADWIEDRHRFERRRAFRRGRRGLSYLSPTASVSVSPARFKSETPENSINRFSPKM